MRTPQVGLMLATLVVVGVLAGCARAKKEATASIEIAKREMANARNVGAEAQAAELMEQARNALHKAEVNMGMTNYSFAKQEADKAITLAAQAQIEATARPRGKRPPTKE